MKTGFSEEFSVVVTEAMMSEFEKISGDSNPLHTDVAYAKKRGFRDKVVYGMLTASFYSTLVGMYLPGKNAILQGMDISFNNPVFPGDRLTVKGEVSYINEAYRMIEISAYIKSDGDKKVSKAKIKVGLYE